MHDYIELSLRTLFLYIVILIIFRMMGKREVGELSVLDLVVFIMIGEMAVVSIDRLDQPIMSTLLPMMILLITQITFAYFSLKSLKFRNLVEGSPTVIISKGKINENAMRSQRYNFDDLLAQLRSQNIINIGDVEYAILETSGELSVIEKSKVKKSAKTGPFPLILDGELQEDNLTYINQTPEWLMQELDKKGYTNIKHISFCSYTDGQLFIDEKNSPEH
ncbi:MULTISPECIES: DUF421 domain-containing protein [Bacillaceae]|uniref:Uncharacterized membrane protein YcaP (DUF421 family) n=1 Tax=Peribacillus huizhouensis TaxID=1501239 RepID=A0ABR6CKX3_9BACI|nr:MULTISPECIES: DUF421 domain-containing protein [Bacillaceae]MBA9025699.1 uncharacterized membrane protein YcaP (DUF421 family) [Peribacillus huizhouensis]